MVPLGPVLLYIQTSTGLVQGSVPVNKPLVFQTTSFYLGFQGVFARRAPINYPNVNPRFTLPEKSPPSRPRVDRKPSLQSTLHKSK